MIGQKLLLKMYTAGLISRRSLERRVWDIEDGEAAGLRLGFPQNLEFVRGSSEVPMQTCITRHLAPGDVFYDVGANVGFFSLLATRCVGACGAVYAFEPVPSNAGAIRRNVRLNALTNVSVFQVAADERSGSAQLFVTKWDGGSSLSAAAIAADEPVEERTVRVVALDELICQENLKPPTLVKVDVEGAELRVFRGMLQTIDRYKPTLLYEVDDADRQSFARRQAALDEFVTDLGYSVTHLEDSYPNLHWCVGHSLAVPLTGTGNGNSSGRFIRR